MATEGPLEYWTRFELRLGDRWQLTSIGPGKDDARTAYEHWSQETSGNVRNVRFLRRGYTVTDPDEG